MFLVILNFIEQCWLLIAGGMVLIVLLFQHLEISHLNNKVASCQSDNTTLANANTKLSQAISSQNAAIANIEAKSQAKQLAAAKSLSLAKTNARKYAAHAQSIKLQRTVGCAGMIRLLDNYVKRRG